MCSKRDKTSRKVHLQFKTTVKGLNIIRKLNTNISLVKI